MRKRLPWLHLSLSRVMLLVLSVTVVSALALCLLAWRLTVLDRAVAQQRDRERLDHAADSASAVLLQGVNEIGERLRSFLENNPARTPRPFAALTGGCDSCRAILIEPGRVTLSPETRLRYFPEPPPAAVIDDGMFAAGEALEFIHHEYGAAAQWFLDLANRSKGGTRAGALVGAARNFIKQKEPGSALAAWSAVEELGTCPMNGEPCELVARFARLPLLGSKAKQSEARPLQGDLEAGRWNLSRASYEYYSGELSSLTGIKPPPAVWEEAVYFTWQFGRAEHIASGERVLQPVASAPLVVVWRTRDDTTAGVVFTPADIRALLSRVRGFAFGLETLDNQILLPASQDKPHADRVFSFANAHWRLSAAATQLESEPRNRQLLLLASLTLVIVLVLTGSYAVLKAVSREQAVARLQADFVSAVSHEFRSPLTTLRSMSEMLERGRVPTEERKQRYYSLISRETQRLHRLVEDLLDFGRMEAGKKQYDMRPTDVSILVSEVVAELSEEYAPGGFEIDVRTMSPVSVLGDPDALRRAVRNLVENAVKYSAGSRRVDVEVRNVEGRVSVSVQDYGMGISRADLNRIFRKFERGAAAKASSIQGTGLGLAMVHGILRAQGGSVRVESEENRGSTFTLVIPGIVTSHESVACRAS
jgi:signal transduction histidine kinase